jgi:tetratricopeptide (TPR) repeat protein
MGRQSVCRQPPLGHVDAIQRHAKAGDALAAQQRYEDAIAAYNKGWALIPEPRNEWEASTWLLAAIADAAFLGGYDGSARKALDYAMTCPGAIGNPFLHLRRGQVLLNQGNNDAAVDELMRAYMAEGEAIFAAEDPKYLAFLKQRVSL